MTLDLNFNNADPQQPEIETNQAKYIQQVVDYIRTIQTAAKQCDCKGKLVIASFGQDPETGRNLTPKIKHISPDDDKEIIRRAVESLLQERHRNIYMPLCLFREDLPAGKKGFEKDIIVVLGFMADFDDNKASQWAERLPIDPSFVLETSKGRFQAGYLFDKPVSTKDAKPIAALLQQYSQCDSGTKDLSHVWRIPGTLNWPNKKKVNEGRNPEPQTVKVVYFQGGAS